MAETKKYLTMKERICFTVGAFGRSGIYTLMSMFTLVFFQNGAGLTLKQGTTIILIGRVFDALNDPVMGMIVDRTKSKWGKMRPYLLFAPIPIAITTIGIHVDFIPTERPLTMLVAEPVCELSAIS